MLVPERRRRVLEHVRRHGSAQVQAMAEELGVSSWTVRRDLAELARDGHLQRAHGGAIAASGPGPAPPTTGTGDRVAAKADIAAAAAPLIDDDSTILLLGGSTTSALLPHLVQRRLTVVTNGLDIADGLKHAADLSLVVLGGYLHRDQMTLLGPMTDLAMAELHVDLLVAGAYGVHPDAGVTGAKIIQAGQHRSMLKHTDALLILADAEKLGRRGPTLLADLDQVTTIVTDAEAPAEIVAELTARGPDVRVAGSTRA